MYFIGYSRTNKIESGLLEYKIHMIEIMIIFMTKILLFFIPMPCKCKNQQMKNLITLFLSLVIDRYPFQSILSVCYVLIYPNTITYFTIHLWHTAYSKNLFSIDSNLSSLSKYILNLLQVNVDRKQGQKEESHLLFIYSLLIHYLPFLLVFSYLIRNSQTLLLSNNIVLTIPNIQ